MNLGPHLTSFYLSGKGVGPKYCSNVGCESWYSKALGYAHIAHLQEQTILTHLIYGKRGMLRNKSEKQGERLCLLLSQLAGGGMKGPAWGISRPADSA